MAKITLKTLLAFFNDLSISLCGLTMIEVLGAGTLQMDWLDNIDNTIKVVAALAGLVILIITTPFRIKMYRIDLENKKTLNEIKKIERRAKAEELKKLERENSKYEN